MSNKTFLVALMFVGVFGLSQPLMAENNPPVITSVDYTNQGGGMMTIDGTISDEAINTCFVTLSWTTFGGLSMSVPIPVEEGYFQITLPQPGGVAEVVVTVTDDHGLEDVEVVDIPF